MSLFFFNCLHRIDSVYFSLEEIMKKKMVIKFKKLTNRAYIPRFAYPDDACFDLFSPVETVIYPQKSVIIDLEIASEFPQVLKSY